MKNIITKNLYLKNAKMNPLEKKKVHKYWQLVFGPDYASEMVEEPNNKPNNKPNNECDSECYRKQK